ncbi:MAG: DUF3043 domain-containing protein [Gordonia sp. (in: high G+C Gram-positive bacteria)]|uniref:DUF3043 domain-containing protein n=1 Tax=Gordonia sp. (in: high G+C Gram-positive bacteria) TaxID=84139 RepID=UPI0039E27071
MKMPWQRSVEEADATEAVVDDEATRAADRKAKQTEGKGRPTPKRRDATKKRGPVAPPPMTRAEARARRKEQRTTMTKEERADLKAKQRELRNEVRDRRMAGDEEYLLPKDKGPARRYARNIVDSRRNFAGLFTPLALVFIVLIYGLPAYAGIVTLLLLVFVLAVVIDLVLVGRKVNKLVRERYPDTEEGGFKLGWYGASRALQMRRLRVPKAQVSYGEEV